MDLKQYLIVCFMEECMETAHAASKVLRFTEDDSPVIGGITNYQNLCKEYSELLVTIEMLRDVGIRLEADPRVMEMKRKRIADYAHYSKLLGVINDPNN